MKKIAAVLALMILLTSCNKDTDPSGALNGGYNGTYYRSGNIKDSAYVRLIFVGSVFSGNSVGSDRTICNGTYNVFADSIKFTNVCNIDPMDLLLDGSYKMTTTGDSLYFTRESQDFIYYKDQFSLKKQ